MSSGPLWHGLSHDEGENRWVDVWPDRIERTRDKSLFSFSRRKKGLEVTQMSDVESIELIRDGVRITRAVVVVLGKPVEYRFPHLDAQAFKGALKHAKPDITDLPSR